MEATTITGAKDDVLVKAIKAAAEPEAKGVAAKAGGFSQFCDAWATIEPGLEALLPLLKLIPGFGTIAAAALGTVLTIGKSAHAALCGGH